MSRDAKDQPAIERILFTEEQIAQRIQEMSRGGLLVPQGSLYPALQRMKRRGWIRSEWRTTENNRRARYYELRPAGRRQLAVQRAAWERASGAVNWVLSAKLAPERAYLAMSWSRDSGWPGSRMMHSTGQTSIHCGTSKCPTHSVQFEGAIS